MTAWVIQFDDNIKVKFTSKKHIHHEFIEFIDLTVSQGSSLLPYKMIIS